MRTYVSRIVILVELALMHDYANMIYNNKL